MVEIFQNIREIYEFKKPCEELMEFIEFFSESSAAGFDLYFSNGHAHAQMFASYTPTFYINLGSPYVIDLDKSRYSIAADEDILILRNGQVARHILPTDRIFTVKFYPGGLEAVLGLSQAALHDQVIKLHEVLPPVLLTKMKQSGGFEERLTIIQDHLLSSYSKRKQKDHYLKIVNDAIGEYSATGMQLNSSQVAEKLFLTSKTINRYFHKAVGVSPKAYFSILRTRSALGNWLQTHNSFDPWAYGYYDISHFSKDVFKLTGTKLSDHP
ncbi:MAG: AraC family transcriptional regulator [Chitinophagaceae bacterium]|nr:AraC family transcriptional regulator [Chitinophagaceae bacterium]